MSNSPVLDLQNAASRTDADISELLRKSLMIATKLNLESTTEWISNELKGYSPEADVPSYRQVATDITVFNPYNGIHMPLVFETDSQREAYTKVTLKQGVPHFQSLLTHEKDLVVELPPAIIAQLMRDDDIMTPPRRRISRSKVHGILIEVQNTILQWTLDLEKQGVVGEGMRFSEQERVIASHGPAITVHGGNVNIIGANSGVSVAGASSITNFIGRVNSSCISDDDKREFATLAKSWDTASPNQRTAVSAKIKSWITDNLVGLGSLGVQIADYVSRP